VGKILLVFAGVVIAAVALWALTRTRPVAPQDSREYTDTVVLRARQVAGTGVATWELSYPATGPAKAVLQLEIGAYNPASAPQFSFAQAMLRGGGGSAPTAFVDELAAALEATSWPHREHSDSLTFEVGILGENLSSGAGGADGRAIAGEFLDSPPGDWLVTKLFLLNGEAEVFLALNASEERGLLIKKDPAYAVDVVAEFQRLF